MEQLIHDALDKSVGLLTGWQKKSAVVGGYGWHELVTSDHAGAHASCAALKLVAHPLFPIPNKDRLQIVDDVVSKFLKPLYVGNGNQADEAKHSTVKVANLLSAFAAIGRNNCLAAIFQPAVPFARSLSDTLVIGERDLRWGHWLDHAASERRHLPTAVAVDAIYRFGEVDAQTKKATSVLLGNFGRNEFDTFVGLTRRTTRPIDVLKLWHRLPLLRTIAITSSPSGNLLDAYRTIFNAYVSHDVFGWGLTSTEDFQKFDGKDPSGTDYVSFNTTACLVRAITAAVQTGKLDLAFFDWATPFLADWALRICNDDLPEPRRFSFIHQTLSCLLAALELQNARKCLPITLPMNINPLFTGRGFQVKPNQGFYVTPFDLAPFGYDRLHVESFIRRACSTYQGNIHKIDLIPGDHNFTGPGIMERIWQHICESDFVIAICFGANPNVYYEIGMAHTVGKPVLLLGREGHKDEDIKFDIQRLRYEPIKDFNNVKEIEDKVHDFLGEVLRF